MGRTGWYGVFLRLLGWHFSLLFFPSVRISILSIWSLYVLNIYFDCFLLILCFGLAVLCEESICSTAVQEGTRGQNGGESGSQQGILKPYCFQWLWTLAICDRNSPHCPRSLYFVVEMIGERRCVQEYSIRYVNKDNWKYVYYWPSDQDRCILVRSSFCILMDRDENKNAKREPGQYSAILTKQGCSIRDLFYGIPRLRVALF